MKGSPRKRRALLLFYDSAKRNCDLGFAAVTIPSADKGAAAVAW